MVEKFIEDIEQNVFPQALLKLKQCKNDEDI